MMPLAEIGAVRKAMQLVGRRHYLGCFEWRHAKRDVY